MRTNGAAFLLAVGLHAGLLFAVRFTGARREAPSTMDVQMEAGAPESPSPLLLESPAEPEPTPAEVAPVPVALPNPEPAIEVVTTTAPTAEPVPMTLPFAPPKPVKRSPPRMAAAPGGGGGAGGARGGRGRDVSSQARFLTNPKPVYPAEAKRARQQGVVLLFVDVTPEGRVSEVRVARSSGFPALDQAALDAVRRWTFEPARAMGMPLASRLEVPVRFSLQ